MCNNCNQNQYQEVYICNECQEEPCVGCPIKDLSTDCVNFDQDPLLYGGVEVVPTNTTLTLALDKILQFIKIKIEEIQNRFRLVNTGTGASIYSGNNLLGEKKIRRLKSSNASVSIVEGTDDINLEVTFPAGVNQDNFVRSITINTTSLPANYTEQDICNYILALPAPQRTILETDSKWNIVIIQP